MAAELASEVRRERRESGGRHHAHLHTSLQGTGVQLAADAQQSDSSLATDLPRRRRVADHPATRDCGSPLRPLPARHTVSPVRARNAARWACSSIDLTERGEHRSVDRPTRGRRRSLGLGGCPADGSARSEGSPARPETPTTRRAVTQPAVSPVAHLLEHRTRWDPADMQKCAAGPASTKRVYTADSPYSPRRGGPSLQSRTSDERPRSLRCDIPGRKEVRSGAAAAAALQYDDGPGEGSPAPQTPRRTGICTRRDPFVPIEITWRHRPQLRQVDSKLPEPCADVAAAGQRPRTCSPGLRRSGTPNSHCPITGRQLG
eukprot:TRINITY_DN7828_c0_g1_i1.p1 TRINITY_DN7828_c0_g1~~TRINITY_DN7828_c0_g1_i1.p1  ORF type:complete len:367 (+),score=39.64 TRINITY_DN7828_c0_g1_i1:153-1103(+)